MEKNEVITLEDRGFIQVKGPEAKDFLQNIVTNDLEKVTNESTIFSSILTPQGKYLFEFFIIKLGNDYLLENEKKSTGEIIKLLNFYKLRSKVDFIDLSEKYVAAVISLEKFKEIDNSKSSLGKTTDYQDNPVYIDPRNVKLGAKIISKLENIHLAIKKLNLNFVDKKKYYTRSFELGIPQTDLDKLKDKIFGIENNLDELNGIDFKKGCYVGQENTSRIKLRNKLRRRILPVQKISGEISENDIIKYKDNEIGKIMINKPCAFALVKVVDPDLKEFNNTELICGNSKVKILKPDWIS
jgi:folate-binding protein YgfZ